MSEATCSCGKLWKWSIYGFVDENGEIYKATTLENFSANPTFDQVHATAYQCTCGRICSIEIDNEFFEIEDFKGVEWI